MKARLLFVSALIAGALAIGGAAAGDPDGGADAGDAGDSGDGGAIDPFAALASDSTAGDKVALAPGPESGSLRARKTITAAQIVWRNRPGTARLRVLRALPAGGYVAEIVRAPRKGALGEAIAHALKAAPIKLIEITGRALPKSLRPNALLYVEVTRAKGARAFTVTKFDVE